MEMWMKIGIIYLLFINLAGFLSMAIDKQKAKRNAWRIPEKTLFIIAILGGSLGSFLGMQVFRHKTKHRQFVIGIPLILLVQVLIVGLLWYQLRGTESRRTDFAMGTVITEVVYGKDCEAVAEAIHDRLVALDTEQLSWREEDSSVYNWNQSLKQGEAVSLDPQEKQWIQTALAIGRDSGGALDITIHPVIDLWGIESDSPTIPGDEAIRQVLAETGYEKLHLTEDGNLYADDSDVSIDLGSLGKGIAADEIRNYLDTQKVTGAVISIGGTILVYGEKPGNGEWNIGIRNPRDAQGTVLGTLTMKTDGIVSTSGDYERYFEQDGVRYHHIFNPATGYPADSGLCSVTIVCEQGIVSDGLSTACFVLGYEQSLPLLEKYNAEAIFVTTDKKVYVTDGLRDSFVLSSPDYDLQP